MTVRAKRPESARCRERLSAILRSSAFSCPRSATSASKVSSWLIETVSLGVSSAARVDPARAVVQEGADLARQEAPHLRLRVAPPARRSSRCPRRAGAPRRAARFPGAGGSETVPGTRPHGRAARPSGLRASAGRSPPWRRPCRRRPRATRTGSSRRARRPARPPRRLGRRGSPRPARRGRDSPRPSPSARRSARPRGWTSQTALEYSR